MRSALMAVTLFALTLIAPFTHGEDGFQLPTLRNPFRSADAEEDSSVNASVSDMAAGEDRGFALPKIPVPKLPKMEMPSWQLPKMETPAWMRSQPSTGPSTWDKFSQGTKSMFVKTRDTLMPWAAPEPAPTRRSVTGSRARVASNANNRRQGDDKPFYSSLIPGGGDEEEPARIETTNDFLSLPRPQFD